MPTLTKVLLLSTAVTMLMPGFAIARDGADDTATASPSVTVSSSPKSGTDTDEHSGLVRPTKMPDASPKVRIEGGQFCSKFETATTTVSSETASRFKKLSDDFTARTTKVETDFSTAETETNKNRTDVDTKIAGKFAALDAQAVTSDQKAAAASYKASVLAAVAARRAAVDAANKTFKAGVKAALAARQTQLSTAAAAYKTAVAAALAKAKASCAAGVAPTTVRATLKSDFDAARATLDAARQTVAHDKLNVEALKTARKAAIHQANATFQTTIKAALAKLKATLGTESPEPSTSASPTSSPTATPGV